MKIFIYGMQSSGASLVTYFLAQNRDSVGIIDLYNHCEAPNIDDAFDKDIILKCVVVTTIPLENHLRSFNPDKKILVLRHPYFNYSSLKYKPYGDDDNGTVDVKFKILDRLLEKESLFDLIIMYEDLLFYPDKVINNINNLGYEVSKDYLKFTRSKNEIINFNSQHCAWCRDFYNKKWGFGNIDFSWSKYKFFKMFNVVSLKDAAKIRSLCPSLYAYYRKNFHWDAYKIFILVWCILFSTLKNIKRKLKCQLDNAKRQKHDFAQI